MRLTDREAIRRALYFAMDWERSLIGAYNPSRMYHHDSDGNLIQGLDEESQRVVDDCRKNIEAFKRVLARYYGEKPRSLDFGKPISIAELLAEKESGDKTE